MAALPSFLLRLLAATIAAVVLAGTTLTLAAGRVSTPEPLIVPAAPKREPLTVPDVTGQAYVFAKGILQDRGFAWHVNGPVQGYAANVVATQTPAGGTSVADTGAPTIDLTLERNSSYSERGTPENAAPYTGTAIQVAGGASQSASTFKPALEPVPVPTAPVAKPRQTVTAPIPVLKPQPAPTPPPAPAPAPAPVTTPTPTIAAPTTTTPAPVATTPAP